MADSRFGVATLSNGVYRSLLDYNRWYRYDDAFYGGMTGGGTGQVGIVKIFTSLSDFATKLQTYPGRVWLIGNEPNNSDQDNASPYQYADWLYNVKSVRDANDSTAILVGPGLLNWSTSLAHGTGLEWSNTFYSYYTSTYGTIPLQAWAQHTYGLSTPPTENAAFDQSELTSCRDWLDTHLNIPIWLTEFGAVDMNGNWSALDSYIDSMSLWLINNNLNISAWFFFSEYSLPGASSASYLVDSNGNLTSSGTRYKQWAERCDPRPGIAVTTTRIDAYSALVSVSSGPDAVINPLSQISFTSVSNIDSITPYGQSEITSFPYSYSLSGRNWEQFTIHRPNTNPMTLTFSVFDQCGAWPTLAGMGAG